MNYLKIGFHHLKIGFHHQPSIIVLKNVSVKLIQKLKALYGWHLYLEDEMIKFPVHVEFELTNHCNLRCIMCPHHIMKRPKGYMIWETFKRAVDECRGHTKTSYLHQIGEPLLHQDLINFINYAEKAGIRTSISTNCMLLDEKKSIGLLGSNLSEIVLCIDSLKPKVFEMIRPGADLKTVFENIARFVRLRNLLNKKMKVIVQMIAMKENVEEHKYFLDVFSVLGVDEAQVKGYSTFAGAMSKGESPASRLATCSKPFNSLTVQWNGDLVTCCRDFDGVTKMGNVNETTITEIWNSEEYAALRKTFKTSDFCRRC